jgi:UDP-glucose 4-epimerase
MRVLNIGGTGFIGSVTTRKLLEKGAEVICFDLVPSMHRMVGLEVEIIPGDVTDFGMLASVMRERRIDTVINFAAFLSAQTEKEPYRAVQVNGLGMSNIFEAARLFDVGRVIYMSSIGAYSNIATAPGTPLREDMPLPAGNTLYACLKQLNEYVGGLYHARWGMDTIAVRPTSVLGLGRTTGPRAWLSNLIESPILGRPCRIPLPRTAGVSWVYVDDLAEIIARLVCVEKPAYSVYNAAAGTTTAGEIADIVRGIYPGAHFDFDDAHTADPHFAQVYDNSRTVKDLKMTYISLQEALQRMCKIAEAKLSQAGR